jgi:hypothetical protein
MLYRIGRCLQVLGLLIAPAGVAGNLAQPEEVNEKALLTIAAAGAGVFFLGWLLQQAARPR